MSKPTTDAGAVTVNPISWTCLAGHKDAETVTFSIVAPKRYCVRCLADALDKLIGEAKVQVKP